MSGLVASERATYEAMWGVPDYAKTSPGQQLVPAFIEMAGITKTRVSASPYSASFWNTQTVLDAGCGSGKGALALKAAGFKVTMADLTPGGLVPEAADLPFFDLCLWDDLRIKGGFRFGGKFDWVYCCDVLEHVPTPFVMLTVHRLLEVARKGVFLSIALQSDNFGVWVGKPLHQTVQTFAQWRDQLSALGTVKECRDMLQNGIYLVEPR